MVSIVMLVFVTNPMFGDGHLPHVLNKELC